MLTISDLLQCLHCVRLFTVLVTCIESMIPRHKNNRPSLVNSERLF